MRFTAKRYKYLDPHTFGGFSQAEVITAILKEHNCSMLTRKTLRYFCSIYITLKTIKSVPNKVYLLNLIREDFLRRFNNSKFFENYANDALKDHIVGAVKTIFKEQLREAIIKENV